ncbi:MAG: hypothetical protein GWN61_21230, partial [candidate division Zixibacteria bacterium]|nr:hypothetical protein [candidate division Zixibacteria bacterium]NIS48389.1 hypothetical protein [candidate division Zixibacteria bacterium]NIU16511.1 hypothetical protein [candidate division Zixibacteria bacterium]NIV08629.1 hypothetical protein [candidate division Zixibacteria bacterium]NIW39773.1 hypothetical protein [candidate division Zixibacteria bacterium]
EDLIEMLENIHEGSLEDQIYHFVHDRGRASVAEILDYSKETLNVIQPAIGDLEQSGRLVVLHKNGKSLQRSDVILGMDYFGR